MGLCHIIRLQIRLWWPAKGEGLNTLTSIHMQQLLRSGARRSGGESVAIEQCERGRWRRRTRCSPLQSMTTHSREAHLLPSEIMHASPESAFALAAWLWQHRHTQDVQQSYGDGFLRFQKQCQTWQYRKRLSKVQMASQQQDLLLDDEYIQVFIGIKMQTDGSSNIVLDFFLSQIRSEIEGWSYFFRKSSHLLCKIALLHFLLWTSIETPRILFHTWFS